MYSFDLQKLKSLGVARLHGVGPNVFFLGLTSMLTDISSEMVASILPMYFLFAVGLSPFQFGIVDGLSQAGAALARLFSGWVADRSQRMREVAAAGYALSASCRLLLPASGANVGMIMGVTALDRVGKGIRSTPRDALISLSSSPDRLGVAFGLHRAMDTVGALLGPAIALLVLGVLPGAFDLVFVLSFCFALLGLATLLSFVRSAPDHHAVAARSGADRSPARHLAATHHFRMIVIAGSALALLTVGEAFAFLALQKKMALDVASFPALLLVTAACYLVLALPAGRLSDRIGRGRVFWLGHVLALLAVANILLFAERPHLGWLSLVLMGAYFACTDGVLMAMVGALVPLGMQAKGMAVAATAVAMSRLASSLLFGALWEWQGFDAALRAYALGLAVVLALTAAPLSRLRTST